MTKRWKLLYQPRLGNSWGRLLFLHQLVNIACDLETVCGKVSSCPGSPRGLADFKASSEWFDRAITSPTSARVKLSKYLKKKNNKKLTRAIAQRVQDRKWERLNRFKLGKGRLNGRLNRGTAIGSNVTYLLWAQAGIWLPVGAQDLSFKSW